MLSSKKVGSKMALRCLQQETVEMEAQVQTSISAPAFLFDYKWCTCFTAGNVRNVHAYEEVGPALPPRGMEEEDQIEMKVYGESATDQVNTGN